MKLQDLINQYIEWRQSQGARFDASSQRLRQFCNSLSVGINCDEVSTEQVLRFLAGRGRLTADRAQKYSILAGFYRYAVSRGYVSRSPLPARDQEPKPTESTDPPYIFSQDEFQTLLSAIPTYQRHGSKLGADTFRVLLLVLYHTGLRISEALNLTLKDVDLEEKILTVNDSKFFKSRLVPISCQLTETLQTHTRRRLQRPLPKGADSALLAYRDGQPLAYATVKYHYIRLLNAAQIPTEKDGCRSPTLHSLRHSFAVRRLTAWYREDADVQRLLPVLSTYLGHANLDGTKVYLSMTPELLHQASLRFDLHVNGGRHE